MRTAPIIKKDPDLIILHQFPGVWGLPNAGPFCMKVETYLRMVELPYEISFMRDPRKAPKGKLPFIKIGEKLIADSDIILDYLKAKFGDVLDKHLTVEQQTLTTLLDSTFSEQLYWFMLYARWQEDATWLRVKKDYFAKLPWFLRLFVPNLVRKQMIKALYIQGTGRYTKDEMLQKAYKTIDAIAAALTEKKYFHGNEITTIDATAFGFLANIAWFPYESSLKEYLYKHKNILVYCDRMWSTFYPELTKPFAIV